MKITSSWDDAGIYDLKLVELLDKYDIEAVFYWPVDPQVANEVKGRKSLSDFQALEIAERYEIGSHTITHPLLTRIAPEAARKEINDSRELLANKFNQEIYKFCYPRGYANHQIQMMVMEAGYESARSVIVGKIFPSENPYFEETSVHVGYQRTEYGEQDWLEYACSLFDQAIKHKNSVFHFWGHSYELEENDDWDNLEMLLRYIK